MCISSVSLLKAVHLLGVKMPFRFHTHIKVLKKNNKNKKAGQASSLCFLSLTPVTSYLFLCSRRELRPESLKKNLQVQSFGPLSSEH